MKEEILQKLIVITEEEKVILDGAISVDKNLYTINGDNVIHWEKLIEKDKQISVRKHTRFIHFPEHTHDYIEAVYMCKGQTTHIINGKEIVLSEGEILFLGQNARQEILPSDENDIAINFIIQPIFFDKTLEMLGTEDTPIKRFLINSLFDKDNQSYLYFKVSNILPVQNLIENLIWTLLNDIPNKRNINQTTMGLLFMQLLNHTDTLVYESREDMAIIEILRYIETNYKNGSLEEASKKLHYDYYWLSHEIKNRTGKSYIEHLQEKRLSQAAFLLKNTSISIENISLTIGYENKSYFYRIFSKSFGMSPKKYRINND